MPNLKCLENIRDPNELNRFLFLIRDLPKVRGHVSKHRLNDILKGTTIHGDFISFMDILNLALIFELVQDHGESILITRFGESFLVANPDCIYPLTDSQKRLLIKSILFGRPDLITEFERIIKKFYFNQTSNRFEGVISAVSGHIPALGLILFCSTIGFLEDAENGKRYFNPIFNKDIALRIYLSNHPEWDGQIPSPEFLERSKHAEVLIYNSEKERLQKEGFHELSEHVQLVSEFDVAAGYDIQSYDGVGSRVEIPDRFIEVKASVQAVPDFYISINEIKRAEEFKERYRVVFVGNHDTGKQLCDCNVQIFVNPRAHIFNPEMFTLVDARKIHVRIRENS